MSPTFKVYGYEDRGSEKLLEIDQVTFAFLSAKDMKAFAKFVEECADQWARDANWAHEHYFNSVGDVDIVLSQLYEDEAS